MISGTLRRSREKLRLPPASVIGADLKLVYHTIIKHSYLIPSHTQTTSNRQNDAYTNRQARSSHSLHPSILHRDCVSRCRGRRRWYEVWWFCFEVCFLLLYSSRDVQEHTLTVYLVMHSQDEKQLARANISANEKSKGTPNPGLGSCYGQH